MLMSDQRFTLLDIPERASRSGRRGRSPEVERDVFRPRFFAFGMSMAAQEEGGRVHCRRGQLALEEERSSDQRWRSI